MNMNNLYIKSAGVAVAVGVGIAAANLLWNEPNQKPEDEVALFNKSAIVEAPNASIGAGLGELPNRDLSTAEVVAELGRLAHPRDPSAPKGTTGCTDEGLRELSKEYLQPIFSQGRAVFKDGKGTSSQLLTLGRISLALGDLEESYPCFKEAHALGSAAAPTYLADAEFYAAHEQDKMPERLALISKSVTAGFQPAEAARKKLETEMETYLDELFAHRDDPQSPNKGWGETDANISQLEARQVKAIITSFEEFASDKNRNGRFLFELGRGAFCQGNYDEAERLFSKAVQHPKAPSAGAWFYLASLPKNKNRIDDNVVFLTNALKGGFAGEECQAAFEVAKNKVFNPQAFGSPSIVAMLYNGDVAGLLEGRGRLNVAVEAGTDSLLNDPLVRKRMTLIYIAAMAKALEDVEGAFLARTEFARAQKGGLGDMADMLRKSSPEIVLMEKYDGLGLEKAFSGIREGDFSKILQVLVQNREGGQTYTQSNIQAIEAVGKTDARKVFDYFEAGNKEVATRVRDSITGFVNGYR